mmetsp:Transcript_14020/g.21225  ORF Transcript_14020/g.21225 Transcript_14020/m.21225 type:complete len:276 (+) Transcript_14020:34-861(+)
MQIWNLSFASMLVIVGAIQPKVENITVYHVNPANYSGVANMDTGDAAGDTTFDVMGFMIPEICRNASGHASGFCDNPEVVSDDLVLTKIIVEVKGDYGEYGRCNICLNGTTPMSIPPTKCEIGKYACVCGNFTKTHECGKKVGKEILTETFAFKPDPGSSFVSFWLYNLIHRTQGIWYSTFAESEGENWELVKEIKKVNGTCQKEKFYASVASYDPQCFQDCPQPTNRTSSCVIDCLVHSLLGKDADTKISTDGLSGEEIIGLWTKAFDDCPNIL